jgi:Na+/H+ antiporter NhaC
MEKENWINEVLESTQGITTVAPDARIFSKIQSKIKVKNTIPMQWVWTAAASMVILVALNIALVSFKTKKEKSATEIMASQLSKSNQLY